MFCLWWKVCLSPSSNIYLWLAPVPLLIQTTARKKSDLHFRTVHENFSLWIQFVSLCTCSILRVICHLDRRLIGVIWQGTWHGSCDMTWYDIVTTLLGGHQPANTHIDVVRSDLRGQYWHYCSSRGYWHYWGGCCCCGGYQCLSSHTAHTALIVWLITSDMARPDEGHYQPLSWIRH